MGGGCLVLLMAERGTCGGERGCCAGENLRVGEFEYVVARCSRYLARGSEYIISSSRYLRSGGDVVVDGVQVWVLLCSEQVQRVCQFSGDGVQVFGFLFLALGVCPTGIPSCFFVSIGFCPPVIGVSFFHPPLPVHF